MKELDADRVHRRILEQLEAVRERVMHDQDGRDDAHSLGVLSGLRLALAIIEQESRSGLKEE